VLAILATPAHAQSARAILDTAIARMGGASLLGNVKRTRFEMLTQWQRVVFDERPYADQPVYESHVDLRDYDLRAWRNTRRFYGLGPSREQVDVVLDSVAIRRSPGGPGGVASPAVVAPGAWTTLNVAYVDERRELFALAPERLLLAARAAADLRLVGDTSIAGASYARVVATVDRYRMTIVVRRSTGVLTAVRFHTDEPNDFGLVPYGEMDVEMWYGAWRKQPDGLVYPYQWDVRRAGRPYKRMTVLAATFNPPATPDSFTVTDSLRGAYFAHATRPMHDLPLDSARLVESHFAAFGTPGAPTGAVKLRGGWLLLETGQGPSSAQRAVEWLAAHDAGSTIAGAVVTMPGSGHGGAPWLAARHVPFFAGPGATPFVAAALHGYAMPASGGTTVTQGRWLDIGGDSLRLEPIDLPDAPGALVVYAPSLHWLYLSGTASPLYLDVVLGHARARGWRVTRYGSARGPVAELPTAPM
jgi:hypothetical protein